jgi:hypothetical protein
MKKTKVIQTSKATNESKIEKQIKKTDGMLNRAQSMYERLKKIEIRNVFRTMPELLNSYKREYGKLIIDVQHVKEPAEIKSANLVVPESNTNENRIGKRLLIFIRSAKNNVLLGALNYTLSTRIFSRLHKEERVVINRQNQLQQKRNNLITKLENANSIKISDPIPNFIKAEASSKEELSALTKLLKKSPEGKKLLKSELITHFVSEAKLVTA